MQETAQRERYLALVPPDVPEAERAAFAERIFLAREAVDRAERNVLSHAKGWARALEVFETDEDDWLTESTFDSLRASSLDLLERLRELGALTWQLRPAPNAEPARDAESTPEEGPAGVAA